MDLDLMYVRFNLYFCFRLYSDARIKVAIGKIVAGVKDFEVKEMLN